MTKAEAFWDNSAAKFDQTEERFASIHRRSRERAREHLNKTDLVLDYGCGTGTTACELSPDVKNIEAIDTSSKMIALAKAKAGAANLENISFAQGDIIHGDYAIESFDAILAFNMLHTVPDTCAVVRRVYELLKPGGLFITVTPCLRGRLSILVTAQIKLVQILCAMGVIPVPIRRLMSSDLDELIMTQRFRIVDTELLFAGASSYFLVAKKASDPKAETDPKLTMR